MFFFALSSYTLSFYRSLKFSRPIAFSYGIKTPLIRFGTRAFSSSRDSVYINTDEFNLIISDFDDLTVARKHLNSVIPNNQAGVYVWTNNINNSQYVGSSSNLKLTSVNTFNLV